MTRGRRSKNRALDGLIGICILLALLYAVAKAVANAVGPAGWALIACAIGFVIVLLSVVKMIDARSQRRRTEFLLDQRRTALLQKYLDPIVVDHIIAGDIWHDMTKEQLIDSWGAPIDIDTKVMKSKIREVYKYNRRGVNRFAARAVLENDIVVGWETK